MTFLYKISNFLVENQILVLLKTEWEENETMMMLLGVKLCVNLIIRFNQIIDYVHEMCK